MEGQFLLQIQPSITIEQTLFYRKSNGITHVICLASVGSRYVIKVVGLLLTKTSHKTGEAEFL